MEFPRNILERIARVADYHNATKYTFESVRAVPAPDPDCRPSAHRVFFDCPKVVLPTSFLDATVGTLALLESGIEALPEDRLRPPQDLRTLATWLHLANGITGTRQLPGTAAKVSLRSCPSASACYPCEVYVAAFAIDGLEPGFYHYSPREFSLRLLRDPHESLAQIRRGRPEFEFLKSVPVALLVSTIFWRSAWKFGHRAYRVATVDAGHVVDNLVTVARGLGVQTLTKLRVSDSSMRELIGLPPDADFGQQEAVQALVAWADEAFCPLPRPEHHEVHHPLPAVDRLPLSPRAEEFPKIVATHRDCVDPGVVLREVRPPLTELSPLPERFPVVPFPPDDAGEPRQPGRPLRDVLLSRRSSGDFQRRALPQAAFLRLNRLVFRGGSFYPMHPDGPHVALVRPVWVVSDVTGFLGGTYYYHPPTDAWSLLNLGEFRAEAAYLSCERPGCGNASAVCFLVANLHELMHKAGPDTYRLAHLEAGIVGQRMHLAAGAMGFACNALGTFYDDDVKRFCGLSGTGWEVIYEVAVGWPPGAARAGGAVA